MTNRQGFIYVATGEGYVREAIRSATSLKRVMPGQAVCLITDCNVKEACFDIILSAQNAVQAPIDKLLAINAPFDRAIFLDTDTFVVGDLSEIFLILDRFDLALLHETRRGWDYQIPGIPHCFSEYNTGLVAFRRTEAVRNFFSLWRNNYDQLQPVLPVPKADQPSFRKTVFETNVRVATLPSEYHFIGDSPNYIMWEAKMIHARGDFERIAADVNSQLGCRVHIPNMGVYGSYHGRKKLVTDCLRFIKKVIQLSLRPPIDPASKIPKSYS